MVDVTRSDVTRIKQQVLGPHCGSHPGLRHCPVVAIKNPNAFPNGREYTTLAVVSQWSAPGTPPDK